ncbi:MAG TPA: DUF4349 domain-containing protein [Bacillota bacterium]|jgi:hypothetical protein|nr:DUF4349 domain-containing protein [Bacillota bacterium]HOC06549.1 DUF4349 domain-containing protein [Bacillota bacterium]
MSRKHLALYLIFFLVLSLAATACSSPTNKANDDEFGGTTPGEYTAEEPDTERKVIYSAYLSVTVTNVDKAVQDLDAKATSLGGYISESNRNHNKEYPTASITYRIPQTKYLEFLAYARSLGEFSTEKTDTTDVTEEYIDLEARLANRLVHEERLLEMLGKAETVEELLFVEKELARVREDIEVIEGKLRYLSQMVEMATVTVYLTEDPGVTEVPDLKPVGIRETLRRALKAIVTSATIFLDILSYLVIALAALLPFALPIAIIVGLILFYRRKKKQAQG